MFHPGPHPRAGTVSFLKKELACRLFMTWLPHEQLAALTIGQGGVGAEQEQPLAGMQS